MAGRLVLVPGSRGLGRKVLERLRGMDVPVRAMVRHDDARAEELRAEGVEVVIGDLTEPDTVARALDGVSRMYFGMSVSPDHLLAATVVATVAKDMRQLDGLVDLSQMTVSQMTATSTAESHQQRLHYLAEQVFNWSGLPVTHVRPTIFLDNPLFTTLAAASIRRDDTLSLPFGAGRTSPIATDDVARVVAVILRDPTPHLGEIYQLTGPRSLDLNGVAEEFTQGIGRPITYRDVPIDGWVADVLPKTGLPPHTQQHIATMARLHRENRYDRATGDVFRVTGQPAQSIAQFVAAHRDIYVS
ncbi:NAD(P)H-binding protein [Herbidospora sp. RD11066]